uniref:Uncharacterized protein n=1 Tax=Oryza nivara TaxID=4536 RepID=A0A0E0HGK9_ORYNI
MLRWDERQWQLGGGALPSRLSLAVRGRRRRQRQSRPPLCQIRGGAARWRPRRGGLVAAEGRQCPPSKHSTNTITHNTRTLYPYEHLRNTRPAYLEIDEITINVLLLTLAVDAALAVVDSTHPDLLAQFAVDAALVGKSAAVNT